MIIVTGSMRSGTSLMMQILQAAGLKPAMDGQRKADYYNPNGYFEIKNIGEKINGNPLYLSTLDGNFVKVVSNYIESVPFEYPVIYMYRDYKEIAASMSQMRDKELDRKEILEIGKHQDETMFAVSNRDVVYISYNHLMADPQQELERLQDIDLQIDFDVVKHVIDKSLYRQNSQNKQRDFEPEFCI